MEGAAVTATLGAAGILLRKLGDALAEKYTLLGGVRDEVQELKDELESLTACLRDLDNGGDDETRSELTWTWMKQVRELGYDAEDCIDIFCHHLSKYPGDGRGLTGHINKIVNLVRTLKVRNKLATNIRSLKSRAQKVSERRLRYKLDAAVANSLNDSMLSSSSYVDVDRRLSALHSDGSRLVGMDDNTDEVIRLLNQDGQPLRVISIVGFGGLGKTVLAKTVCNKQEVGEIRSRAFVPVSRTYDLRLLLASMVRELVPIPINKDGSVKTEEDPLKGIESWEIWQLIQKSNQHLADKRYLVVLDDVWSPAAWESLKTAFPDNKKGSTIIVTTRSHLVAKGCSSSNDYVYKMEHLRKEDSKKLLFKTMFDDENLPSAYNQLEHVCNAVLEKCGDLPLAIISMGGMLAQRKDEPLANLQTLIDRLPSELQTNGTLDGMGRVLSLSYNDLPYHMKACFLYLTVFPEDHEIRRGPLVRRWAAEGFISPMHGLSLEEVAQVCFDGFVSRSVVSPEHLTSNREVRSFKLHDIMLDVVTSKAIQKNFVSFLGNPQHDTVVGHDNIRRLSVQPGKKGKDFFRTSLPHLRSLIILGSTEKPESLTFTELKLLRVLDLEGCRWLGNQDLKGICKLSLLRYLSIRDTSISRLPSMVGELKELMTLDVRQTSVKELPRSITQLQKLNHLLAGEYVYYTSSNSVKHFAYDKAVMIPPGLSKMTALQRLSFVDVARSTHGSLQEVLKLTQLTRLCAMQTKPEATWDNFAKSLSKLNTSLRYLSIMQDEGDGSVDGQLDFLVCVRPIPLLLQSLHLVGRLRSLPPWIRDLKNLASVSLRHSNLRGTEVADVLGNLPSLVSLKLYHRSYMGAELCFAGGQFRILKHLVIDNLPDLVSLSFESWEPNNLEKLTLYFPRSDTRVLGIQSLKKLTEVEFFGTNNDQVVEGVTEEAKKLSKPPRVNFQR